MHHKLRSTYNPCFVGRIQMQHFVDPALGVRRLVLIPQRLMIHAKTRCIPLSKVARVHGQLQRSRLWFELQFLFLLDMINNILDTINGVKLH